MKKRLQRDENHPLNPYIEIARKKFFKPEELPTNPYYRQIVSTIPGDMTKNNSEVQRLKQLDDFQPIIEQWYFYLSEIITENYTADERFGYHEVIEDSLIQYEKKHPDIYTYLCENLGNHSYREKNVYTTMTAIKTFDALAPLNFDNNFLDRMRKKLPTFYKTVHTNMGLFIRNQKALHDYLSSCQFNPSADNLRIIIRSVSRIEEFIQSLISTFNLEKLKLEACILQTEEFVNSDPIASYLHASLTERVNYLVENLQHITEFSDICTKNKQNLQCSLTNMTHKDLDEELDFEHESLSSSSGI